MSTNNAVNNGLSGQTGTGNFVGSTAPSITNPTIVNEILDTNGNKLITLTPIANAVNYVDIQNSATTNAVGWGAKGSDSDIIWSLGGKGVGNVQIQGTRGANNADPTFVGEFFSSLILSASAISLSSGTSANVTSITLSAGDYDVWGNVLVAGSAANLTAVTMWISSTSATLPDVSLVTQEFPANPANVIGQPVPTLRFNSASNQTIFLSTRAVFGSGTATACGGIYARRRR